MIHVCRIQAGGSFTVSSYEPLDLFSQQPARMQAALQALLAVPQNNLQAWAHATVAGVEQLLTTVAGWGFEEPKAAFAEIVSAALLDSGVPAGSVSHARLDQPGLFQLCSSALVQLEVLHVHPSNSSKLVPTGAA